MSQQNGFTLVEVLIALAVAAIALTALTQAGARYLATQSGLEQRVAATYLAENELVRLHTGLQTAIKDGVSTSFASRQWVIRTQQQPTPVPGMAQLKVQVYLKGDKYPSAQLMTVVAP